MKRYHLEGEDVYQILHQSGSWVKYTDVVSEIQRLRDISIQLAGLIECAYRSGCADGEHVSADSGWSKSIHRAELMQIIERMQK